MSRRETVLEAVDRVRADRGLPARAPAGETLLGEGGLGLDSLDMATVVAELEVALQVDPFAHATPRLVTVADLLRLYGAE